MEEAYEGMMTGRAFENFLHADTIQRIFGDHCCDDIVEAKLPSGTATDL